MSKKNSVLLMAALAAMTVFKPSLSLAQSPTAFSPKIKTPNTGQELMNDKPAQKKPVIEEPEERDPPGPSYSHSGSPRRFGQHGLGLGLGQTFLFGNYGKHGQDKITADVLYSYAASYSFDLLVNAHMSEHKDNGERMKVRGLTTSIKGRFVEYDNFSPYFLGGLGFYAPQARRTIGTSEKWTSQKVTFGLNFGAGVDLRLNDKFVVGVMAQTHWPFKVQQDVGDDLKGYYMKLLLTGMYLF